MIKAEEEEFVSEEGEEQVKEGEEQTKEGEEQTKEGEEQTKEGEEQKSRVTCVCEIVISCLSLTHFHQSTRESPNPAQPQQEAGRFYF
uniref:Uncharacterized protein n=1 Tax=Knipowitschia caucasica TaxID=637954 RepID=A0AAV2KTE2_KNICA